MLEKAIISGVTHDTSEAKVVDLRRPRPARHRREGLPRARRRRREHRHDRAERLRARRDDITFTLPKTDVPVAEPILDALGERDRRDRRRARPGHREDLADRRGHEEPPGRRGGHVRRARRGRDQHRDHLDVVDPRLVRDPRRRGRARGAGRARALPDASPRSASMPRAARRIGVVGATGAVGTVTLEPAARARLRERARLRVGPLGRAGSSAACTVEEATPEALSRGDIDVFLFSVGTGASRELVPHAVRGGAVAVDKSSAYRLEPGIPLVVPEVNASRALEHDGHRREPELLHDPAHLRRSSRCTRRRASCACASRRTSRSPAPARRRWSGCATSRRPSTTCAWTGTSTARSSTRSRSSAPRRGRSWSCPSCRSRRRACACR